MHDAAPPPVPSITTPTQARISPQDAARDDTAALLPPWSVRQTWIGVALTLGPFLLLTLGALALSSRTGSVPQRRLTPAEDALRGVLGFAFTGVFEAAFLIAPLLYAYRTLPGRQTLLGALRALGLRGFSWGRALVVGGGAVGLVLLAGSLYDLVKGYFNVQTNTDVLAEQMKYMPYTTLGLLLAGVVFAPLCEEVFFRGFVFPGLARGMNVWLAVVVSAVLFGAAHGDLGSLAPLIVIGLALAIVRWKTRSLWPAVILHALNNGLALVLLLPLIPR